MSRASRPAPVACARPSSQGGRNGARYHPAVIAQQATTLQLLSQGRFRLGRGSGENLNEHVVGRGRPPAPVRLDKYVRPDDIAAAVPCGDDVGRFVEAVRPYVDTGFTEVALVQIGGDRQEPFLRWAEAELLPALREL
ncbi:LLM class flavin-dependent oxidoreductase [Streptomyces sp. BP-8]|uniref:LLM class flavin-dependent oxidoreductase n=1 Tax=Streptomyces sirii TaxID=3127701 RepID=UPI00388F92B5